MEKKISEMTLEELQDYALSLEEEKTKQAEEVTNMTQKITELTDLNHTLQKRNNDLFMKVDQQRQNPTKDQPGSADEPDTMTCEDLAKKLFINKEIRV